MTKINYYRIGFVALLVSILAFYGFKPEEGNKNVKWLQITAVESVVPGGLGRSRMISIDDQGKMEETKMKNFFSMAGINFEISGKMILALLQRSRNCQQKAGNYMM